jgi:hypothetical protein
MNAQRRPQAIGPAPYACRRNMQHGSDAASETAVGVDDAVGGADLDAAIALRGADTCIAAIRTVAPCSRPVPLYATPSASAMAALLLLQLFAPMTCCFFKMFLQ